MRPRRHYKFTFRFWLSSLVAGVSNFLPPKDTTLPPLLLETPFSAHARHCLLHFVQVSTYKHSVLLFLHFMPTAIVWASPVPKPSVRTVLGMRLLCEHLCFPSDRNSNHHSLASKKCKLYWGSGNQTCVSIMCVFAVTNSIHLPPKSAKATTKLTSSKNHTGNETIVWAFVLP